MRRRLGQFGLGIGQGFQVVGPAHRLFQHHYRQRIGGALAIGGEVPAGQQRLCLLQVRLVSQVQLFHAIEHPGDIARALVPGIEFDREQPLAGDRPGFAEQLDRAPRAVGHVELHPPDRRDRGRINLAARPSGQQRGVVRIEHEARGGIDHLGITGVGDRPLPDQAGIGARQHPAPIRSRFAIGHRGVVDHGDVAGLVGIDEVGRGHALQRHRGAPFGKVLGLVQPVILLDAFDAAHPGIAHRERAARGDQRRAMRAAPDIARDRQGKRAEFDRQPGQRVFQRLPLPVELVIMRSGIDFQLVDIDHVGPVDRVGPAQRLVVAQEREGRSGEGGPGKMRALITVDRQLVPGDPAAIGLMAVRQQPGGVITRTRRGNRKGVRSRHAGIRAHRQRHRAGRNQIFAEGLAQCGGRPWGQGRAVFGQHRLALAQRRKHPVKPEEEWQAQHEAGGDVLAVDREQSGQLDFAGMQRGIAVKPAGITIEHAAHFRRKRVHLVARGLPCPQPVIGEIHPGAVFASDRAIAPAGHRHYVLQGGKIILGMRKGCAERGIGIGLAVDVRNAEFVTRDLCRIVPIGRRRSGLFGEERFPAGQSDHRGQGYPQRGPARALRPSDHDQSFSLRPCVRLRRRKKPSTPCVAKWPHYLRV